MCNNNFLFRRTICMFYNPLDHQQRHTTARRKQQLEFLPSFHANDSVRLEYLHRHKRSTLACIFWNRARQSEELLKNVSCFPNCENLHSTVMPSLSLLELHPNFVSLSRFLATHTYNVHLTQNSQRTCCLNFPGCFTISRENFSLSFTSPHIFTATFRIICSL